MINHAVAPLGRPRVRVFDTGQGRKTDPVDAHSVAVAGLPTPGLRAVTVDDATVALRLLVDRRDEPGRSRTETVSRIHHLLLELIPGGPRSSSPAARPSSIRASLSKMGSAVFLKFGGDAIM
jgi:Transposase